MNSKMRAAPKLDRRQFLKLGTLATAPGILMGASKKHNPLKITNKCKRMDQKYTIFARQLWDHEFVKKVESSIEPRRSVTNAPHHRSPSRRKKPRMLHTLDGVAPTGLGQIEAGNRHGLTVVVGQFQNAPVGGHYLGVAR